MSNLSWQKTHLRELLWLLIQKYHPNCCICGKPFTLADFPKRMTDLVTEHHLDGDHMNMRLENRSIAHRSCHKSHHMKERRAEQTIAASERLKKGKSLRDLQW